MQQSAYLKQSLHFATKIQKHVKEKAGRFDKGVQQAGFLVLWRTSMPSVLIETEFLSSTESENYLSSEKGQDNLSRSLYSAFREYKDEVEGKITKYDDEIEKEKPYKAFPKALQKEKAEEIETIQPLGTLHETHKAADTKDSTALAIKKDTTTPSTADTVKPLFNKVTMAVAKDMGDTKADTDTNTEKKDSSTSAILFSENLIYKVQFLSSSKRIPLLSDTFKGLKDVGEYQDGALYKYTSGEFKTIAEASDYKKHIQSMGYSDCFVAKFKDGKRVKN
jgi:N-acetylmuramoyl-L-alanine amidase